MLSRPRAAALALLAGLLIAIAFPRISFWPGAWLAMIPLLRALRGRGFWGGLWVGWLTGAFTSFLGYSWVLGLLGRFSHIPAAAAGVGWVLSSIAHGLPLAATGALAATMMRREIRPIVALPLAWVAGELIVPTVFPWLLGTSQSELLVLIQIADVVGARGVSAIVALTGAALYSLVTQPSDARARRDAVIALTLLACVHIYGVVRFVQVEARREQAPTLAVGLVQANISIEDKHDPEHHPISLALHQDMSAELEARGADIVVWPESAYPYSVRRGAREEPGGDRAIRRGFSIPLIFGADSAEGRGRRRYNSAFLLSADGELSEPSDKNRLVPFAERIPFYNDSEMLQRMFPNAWNFTAGTSPVLLRDGPVHAGVLNCYEDILPDYVIEVAREHPNLLVNVTNDAWFGDSAEPFQHASAAVYRAVEHRVDLVRAVNTGVSSAIASTGVVLAQTPIMRRRALLVTVRLAEAGTIYTALGDTWAWLSVAMIPLLLWRRRPLQ